EYSRGLIKGGSRPRRGASRACRRDRSRAPRRDVGAESRAAPGPVPDAASSALVPLTRQARRCSDEPSPVGLGPGPGIRVRPGAGPYPIERESLTEEGTAWAPTMARAE